MSKLLLKTFYENSNSGCSFSLKNFGSDKVLINILKRKHRTVIGDIHCFVWITDLKGVVWRLMI